VWVPPASTLVSTLRYPEPTGRRICPKLVFWISCVILNADARGLKIRVKARTSRDGRNIGQVRYLSEEVDKDTGRTTA